MAASLLEDSLLMWVVLVVVIAVLLSVGLYVGLTSSGIVPGAERQERPERSGPGFAGRTGYPTFGHDRSNESSAGMFGIFPRVPRLRELPQGCLLALIVASALWCIGWTVLLVLAIGLLSRIS